MSSANSPLLKTLFRFPSPVGEGVRRTDEAGQGGGNLRKESRHNVLALFFVQNAIFATPFETHKLNF